MFSICALNYMAQLQISWPAAEKQLKPEISLQCTCVLSILEQILMHQGVCVCTLQLKSYLTEGKMYHLGFPLPFFFGLGGQSTFLCLPLCSHWKSKLF